MSNGFRPVLRIAALLFLAVPLTTWVFVKPSRVVAPALLGIECLPSGICVDDPNQKYRAAELYADAVEFVDTGIYLLQGVPRVIFCATQTCADRFGLGERSALTFGTYGSVIGPGAWKPYYVRHELIHQAQGQRLGVIKCLTLPAWLIEGMAYSLSEDPRSTLNPPWQGYRAQFENWLKGIGKNNMWRRMARE